ncbi:SEC14-like protein 2 [Dermacentor andersoni]|uniref:SEC14-like protein 2 n=1 Tax=Dermacentor andersoni TaxID=34620 RepID=UPI002155B58E|nr:SEC14-like protein 2 [Dermacentor andersoni]
MSGYLQDLDERQRTTLEQFREAVADVRGPEHTDANLLRWLRAREFDLDRAEHMFRQHLRWRKENGVDTLLTDYKVPKVMRENFPGGILDCNPKGHPVWLINIGSVDIKGFLQVLPQADIYRHCMYLLELQEKIKKDTSRKLGREIETQYVIMDYEGFSVRQLYSWQVLNLLTELLKMYETNFPESLEKAFVINVPSFFPVLWKMMRPLLTQRTVNKVGIYGKDGWKAALAECMDLTKLPAQWGGTLKGPDGDPRCPHLVCPGGEVPDEYRDELASKKLWGREGVQQFCVDRRGRYEMPVAVDQAGCRIRWTFQTAKGDLAFGVRFQPPAGGGGGVEEQLLELHRIPSCSLVPEHGSHVCTKPGTYVLQFDNSFSWMSSKEVAYEIQIVPPPPPAS